MKNKIHGSITKIEFSLLHPFWFKKRQIPENHSYILGIGFVPETLLLSWPASDQNLVWKQRFW